jgi:bifunctional non-homologous end joining protein LigD
MKDAKKTIPRQPAVILPMLATLIKQPFNDDSYVHEIKWDGYRIIAHRVGDTVVLQSRGGENYSKKYPSIVKALKEFEDDFIIDGEIVYINSEGKPDFDALQRVNGQRAPVIYYAFDLLFLNLENLMMLPLLERKETLQTLLKGNSNIRYSDHFDDAIVLFEHAKQIGLEGIVSKDKNSPYVPDQRGKRWYKIPIEHKQEYVIGGWIESEKRDTFRTLLFGEYDDEGRLKWVGHAGGGYKDHEMPAILKRLKELETDESPFFNEVEYSEGLPHWVRPELVANIKYSTFTKSGKIRKPAIFLGFRNDKLSTQVINQVAKEHIARVKETKSIKHIETSSDSNWPALERIPITTRGELQISDVSISVHNVEKEIWKGITKADLLTYYNRVAEYILPHVQNRPLSLHIKHQGVNAPGLYIKDMEGRDPGYVGVYRTARKHKKPGKRDVIDYLVCTNTATLLYTINLGCIDLNPWTSTVENPLHPSYIVIDLDPSDGDFAKAIDSAKAAKHFFDERKLKAFAKTSGKTGIHLFIPCTVFTFPQARRIAENICSQIHELVPHITTTEITVADRGSRLYLDPNQNDYADTVAAPYCTRPFKRPTVSTPLNWKEIKTGLTPEAFTINTIFKRLEKKGDLFLNALDKTIAVKNDSYLKLLL